MNKDTASALFEYRLGNETPDPKYILDPDARILEHDTRRGLHLPSVRGRFLLPNHTLNSPRGTLTMWVLPLHDLFPSAHYPEHASSNPFFDRYIFLSDRENVGNITAAQFAFYYCACWHPGLIAKFKEGDNLYWQAERGASATSGHFEMKRLRWYQMALTWDRPGGQYAAYANGVLVATHDMSFPAPLPSESCGTNLFGGNPGLAYSDISFFDRTLSAEEIAEKFQGEAHTVDPVLQEHLEKTFAGKGLKAFDWKPDDSWSESLSLPLNRSEDLLEFYQQGGIVGTEVTSEGTRITTPPLEAYYKRQMVEKTGLGLYPEKTDTTRMYLWSRRMFEGDLYATFEFQILAHGGLCLFVAQASGMQGEDFMKDYFLRTDGAMRMICWEDVRNYHWEFYREIADARNDLVSHACLKNPWFKPMNFQIENRKWELHRWYRFEFLQEDARIRGAIDGVTVMDVTDTGFDNNGPVLRMGHIAIRCMMQTDMLFRNLRVLNRPDFQVISNPR